MDEPISKYAAGTTSRYAVRRLGKPRLRTRAGKELPWVKTDIQEIAAYGYRFGHAIRLHMEIRRLSNLRKFKKRDGWIVLSREIFEAIGLLDRRHRSQVVRRLVSWGWLDTRGEKGQGLEYRVPLDWAKAKAEVG